MSGFCGGATGGRTCIVERSRSHRGEEVDTERGREIVGRRVGGEEGDGRVGG